MICVFLSTNGAESIKSGLAVKMRTMSRTTLQRAVYGVVIALSLMRVVQTSGQTRPADQFPEGPGKSTFIKVCTQCHDVDKVTGLRYSREEWQSLVDEMKAMGGDATDEEWKAVVEYLATNFPRESQ